MGVAFNVNIVLERWRQEVHWDVSIKNAFYTHDLPSIFVEFLHFKHIVLLASMLGKDEVVEGVHVKVHVLCAHYFGILLETLVAHDLNADVLVV